MRFYFTEPSMVFRSARGTTYTLREISHLGRDGQVHVQRDGLYIYLDGEPYWPTPDALEHVIDVSAEITRLDAPSTPHVLAALDQLQYVAQRRPHDVLAALPKLELLLDRDESSCIAATVRLLAAIATDHPHALVPLSDELLDAANDTTTGNVHSDIADCVHAIATVVPRSFTDDIPALLDIVDDAPPATIQTILETLTLIADEHPDALTPHLSDIGALLPSLSMSNTRQALVCIAILTIHDYEQGRFYFKDFLQGIDPRAEGHTVIAEAVTKLSHQYSDLAAPYLPYLLALVEASVAPIQRELLRIVINQANTNPELIEPAIDLIIQLLDSSDAIVRKNAILVLGTLETPAAVEPLRALRETTELKEIKWHARWALQRIRLATE